MDLEKKSGKQRITKIEAQKRNPRRVSIYLDGEFAIGVDAQVAQDLGLRRGLALSRSELQKLIGAEEKSKAKNFALDFIGYRARSVQEVQERLKRRGHSQEIIEPVVEELLRSGFLDDVQFASQWARGRMATRPLGEHLLRQELRSKGLSEEIVEQTVSNTYAHTSQEELAIDLLRARERYYRGLEAAKAKRRMADFLLRRGFSREIVWAAVNHMMEQESWD